MWDWASTITSSPGRVCAATAARLPIVPLGTNTAASLPSRSAISASRRFTVGSSPHTSSPTSARAMAARMRESGTVKVSLRRSMMVVGTGAGLRFLRAGTVYHSHGSPPSGHSMLGIRRHARAVPAGPFRAVESLVGQAEQFARAVDVLRERRATDADGDPQLDAF